MNIFSNRFEVEFNEDRDAVRIWLPEPRKLQAPLIEIQCKTLAAMSLKEAAAFIGEPIILLTPSLKEIFRDYLWSDDGKPPKLK